MAQQINETERWEIANPIGEMSFPELRRYTQSDDWEVTFDGSFPSEGEALTAIREIQADTDGWYATKRLGDRYVSTIVEPLTSEGKAE